MCLTLNLARRVVTLLVATVLASAALANGPEIGRDAGGIVPVASNDIQLVSEEVVVALGDHDRPGRARCVYRLRNLTDQDRTPSAAFYITSVGMGISMDYPAFASRLEFRAVQDGRELAVCFEKIDSDRWIALAAAVVDSLPTWTMTIPARSDTQLELDYQVVWSGGSDGRTGHRSFTYHARPARLWAGVIEEAVIEFHFDAATMDLIEAHRGRDDCFELRIEPEGYERAGNTIRWRFCDWDATADPHVEVSYSW